MEMQSSTTIAMEQESKLLGPPAANRHRLPDERPAITHHFVVGGHEGYLTVGLYPNGQPGEIFIRMAKEGSTIAGLMECFGTVVSVSLHTACHCGCFATSCRTPVLSHRAGQEMRIWACQVDHGLSVPLARFPLPLRESTDSVFRVQQSRRCRFRKGGADFVTRIWIWRCASLPLVRCSHDSKRKLLHVWQLWRDEWMLMTFG